MHKILTIEAVKHPILGEARLLELASDLAIAGASTKIVGTLTGLPLKRIRLLFKQVPSIDLAYGPIHFPEPKYFAAISPKVNPSINLYSAKLLSAHTLIKELLSKHIGPIHEGSLLLKAFEIYKQELAHHCLPDQNEIDLNRAYILTRYHGSDLSLDQCAACGTNIVVLRWFDKMNQRCPLCTKSNYMHHMTTVKKTSSRQAKLPLSA